MRESGKGLLGAVAPLFKAADVATANLEHALARSGKLMKGKPTFHRGNPELAEGLAEAGFDVLTIANNHMLDYGEESLQETLQVLKRHNLPFTGAGRNLEEAATPVVLERKGLKVGVLGYSSTLPQGAAAGPDAMGVNPLRAATAYRPLRDTDEYPGLVPEIVTWAVPEDLERMRDDIWALKRKADVVLINQHWGTSMTPRVHDFQREIGRAAIDAGADAVFGGHQHVLSAIEFYKGKPILHCTGNLIFDKFEPFFTEETLKTFLFGCTLTKDGPKDFYLVPCKCGVKEPCQVLSPGDGLGAEIVRQVGALSAPYGVKLERKGDRVAVLGGSSGPYQQSRPPSTSTTAPFM
jgi:poly-gamma-glutamate synthesis protein (capsule biosynthesis protein)